MIMVYTAITNEYDTLKPQPRFEGVNYVCFTDQEDLRDVNDIWQIKYLNKLDHKKPKILAHEYMHGLEHAIWIDGNVTLKEHPQKLIDCLGENDIALFRARDYDCAYNEAMKVIQGRLAPQEVVTQQIRAYVEKGFPEQFGLWACTVIVRKNTNDARLFNNGWWEQIQNYTRRDQISFPYIKWLTDFKVSEIPGNIFENEYVNWHKTHNGK